MMHFFGRVLSVIGLVSLLSCAESPPPAEAEPQQSTVEKTLKEPKRYIETGDLEAIQAHKKLRLLAPRFDGADALPREGFPVEIYQAQAEKFAQTLNLDAQWIYYDNFSDLISALNEGHGDIVVTNMTATKARLSQASFTRPINRVDEVVITPKSTIIGTVEALATLKIAVKESSSFEESLSKLVKKQQLSLETELVASSLSNTDLIAALANGDYEAIVLDSNIAKLLLQDYPSLHIAYTLEQNRAIAWAVRKNAPKLLDITNQFLVASALQRSTEMAAKRDWPAIKQSGRLRMLTLNNPANYFMWKGELLGFDYDLLKKFAKTNGLHLAVTVKDNHEQLIKALLDGEGDVIAASMTATPEREAEGLVFSRRYLEVNEQIISAKPELQLNDVTALQGKRVGVNSGTVFAKQFEALQQQGIGLTLVRYDDLSTEQLIAKLIEGEFDYMAADSHLIALEQAHNEHPLYLYDWSEKSDIAWALRPDQDQLKAQLDQFIRKQYKGLFYNVSFNKYFKNDGQIQKYQADRIETGSALSPYDDLVKKYARKYNMDWRLVVSQMYQESRFNPDAHSFANAQGLMQVLPRTGKQFGFDDLKKPENGLAAGVVYMNWLEKRFPGELDLQERIFFAIAAYNAGAGHVRDARTLARKQGLNPNKWFDNVEKAMLLLSKPEYYKKARFGYVRGKEPVNYVREIRDRYLGYLQLQNTGE